MQRIAPNRRYNAAQFGPFQAGENAKMKGGMMDKFSAFIKSMEQDTDELVEGLLETIERLTVGNPRLNKFERQTFSRFLHVVIQQMAVTIKMLQQGDENRLQDKQLNELSKQADKLHKQNDEAMIDILRGLRELLLDNRVSNAIDLLTQIINYKDKS